MMEATGGFEPPNRGFADPRLKPLGYVAKFLKYFLLLSYMVPRARIELARP